MNCVAQPDGSTICYPDPPPAGGINWPAIVAGSAIGTLVGTIVGTMLQETRLPLVSPHHHGAGGHAVHDGLERTRHYPLSAIEARLARSHMATSWNGSTCSCGWHGAAGGWTGHYKAATGQSAPAGQAPVLRVAGGYGRRRPAQARRRVPARATIRR